MIDTKKWNIDFIGEKVIKPMYEDGKFPLELADQVRDAIEKQIPKKVKSADVGYMMYGCPNCDHTDQSWSLGIKKTYCPRCGQALDWRNSNEQT